VGGLTLYTGAELSHTAQHRTKCYKIPDSEAQNPCGTNTSRPICPIIRVGLVPYTSRMVPVPVIRLQRALSPRFMNDDDDDDDDDDENMKEIIVK